MDFSKALEAVKKNGRISRKGWNGKGLHVEIQRPDKNSKMTLPYLFLVYPETEKSGPSRVPWLASQTDLLAEDWETLTDTRSETKLKLFGYRNEKGHAVYLESSFSGNQYLTRDSRLDKFVQ